MSQLRYTSSWTDEAMDDANTIYTTTTTHAWRTRAKTEMTTTTAELEVLRQARLAEVINRVLSEAPKTRKSRRRSQIDLANCGEQIGTCTCI